MKRVRILALLMATLLLAACAVAETADPIVVTVGEKTVLLSEAQAYFDSLYEQYSQYYESYGLALTAEDIAYIRDEAVETLAMDAIIGIKAVELALDEITEEDLAALRVETDLYFDEYVAAYAENYGLTIEEVQEDMEASGMTRDVLYEQTVESLPYNRVYEYITKDVAVADEALEAEYGQYVESDKQTYANDAATYEMYTNYYGSQIFYIPEGFRLVKHILLETPAQIAADLADFETDISAVEAEISALNTELYALENVPDESETAEEAEAPAPRTAEEIEAAIAEKTDALEKLNAEYETLHAQILPELKATTDEIYKKLEDGETFEALIAAYGMDPGMETETNGYKVHKDSVIWDTDFRDAAVALEKIGDVSDPILTGFGVHIIQYVGDAESGPVPMSEEIRQTLSESMLQTAMDEAFTKALDEWIAEYAVEKYPDLIVLPQVAEVETIEDGTEPEEGVESEDDAESVSEDKAAG